MHVGIFIDGYFPCIDGVIKVADAYASRLARKCDVTVFTPFTRNFEPGYDDRFPYKVVRCRSIMRETDDYPQGLPFLDPGFKASIRSAGLDIIHIHTVYPIGLCAKAFSRRLGIPMVATIHSDFRPDVTGILGKFIGEPRPGAPGSGGIPAYTRRTRYAPRRRRSAAGARRRGTSRASSPPAP